MSFHRGRVAGTGAMAILIAMAIAYAAFTAKVRTVRLDNEGAAIATTDPRFVWPDMRIDLNAATAAELALLPGLGPALAERIVAHRDFNGPFASVDGLLHVKGIGPTLLERLRPFAVADQHAVKTDQPHD